MTTVLSVGNSEGTRRCDARCHDASQPGCDCVCGGRYHGGGRVQVLERVAEDVLGGEFGEVVAVEGRSHLHYLMENQPEAVRYHGREVAQELRRIGSRSSALQLGLLRPVISAPAKLGEVGSGGLPHG